MEFKKRIVVKVGTSTLTHAGGQLNLRCMDELCRTLADLHHSGHEMVLVTSGAIGVGTAKLGLTARPRETRYKQAAAAVGQCELMHLYDKFFGEYGLPVAQILLTRDVLDTPHRYVHARNTLQSIIEYGAIPVVNENDSVAVDELEFGDNDTLSADVARLCDANLLIILSDIDGFYDRNPSLPEARRLSVVGEITEAMRNAAGGAGSQHGTGGMVTKLHAADIAMAADIPMALAKGAHPADLYELCKDCQTSVVNATWFIKEKEALQ